MTLDRWRALRPHDQEAALRTAQERKAADMKDAETSCPRCNGRGRLVGFSPNDGVCHLCGGSGRVPLRAKDLGD